MANTHKNPVDPSANAQALAGASRVHRLAKARGISARAACRLVARELIGARSLEEAFQTVERIPTPSKSRPTPPATAVGVGHATE